MQIGGALLKYLYSDWKTEKKKKKKRFADLRGKAIGIIMPRVSA